MELVGGARNRRELTRFLQGIAGWSIVWPKDEDCADALSDFSRFHLSHGLGAFDALIARTAMGMSATLCTFNVRHFRPIAGLIIEQPYGR